jgi:glutamyl-Q tRNA(Asp) synthetase
VSYVGRFAPSPTGSLHLGTLTAAVAGFLHARQRDGSWLVRIEDVDPPREVPGSAASILKSLEAMDLEWDGAVLFQSSRIDEYRARALELVTSGQAYYCSCSRQDIRALTGGSRYPGTCRRRQLTAGDTAIRLRTDVGAVEFVDRLQGGIQRDIDAADGDFVIVRRDGLPAYHLAVVVVDAEQQITDIVRGADLLDSTPLHILLQRRLAVPTPNYWHVPLITDSSGEKLSKRTGAPPIDTQNAAQTAAAVLRLLGLTLPADLEGARPKTLWHWAEQNWRIDSLVGRD